MSEHSLRAEARRVSTQIRRGQFQLHAFHDCVPGTNEVLRVSHTHLVPGNDTGVLILPLAVLREDDARRHPPTPSPEPRTPTTGTAFLTALDVSNVSIDGEEVSNDRTLEEGGQTLEEGGRTLEEGGRGPLVWEERRSKGHAVRPARMSARNVTSFQCKLKKKIQFPSKRVFCNFSAQGRMWGGGMLVKPQTATLNLRPLTLNPQPSALSPQPSTLNPQPSTLNPKLSTLNPQP